MENKQDKQEWYRVTITNNETGEVMIDTVTKAIMLVMLFENDETRRRAAETKALSASGVAVEKLASRVDPFDLLSLVDGMQGLLQEIMEEYPLLQLLAQNTRTERTYLDETEDE